MTATQWPRRYLIGLVAIAALITAGCARNGPVDTDAAQQVTSSAHSAADDQEDGESAGELDEPTAESLDSDTPAVTLADEPVEADNCPMTAGWDIEDETTALGIGEGIVGISGGSLECFDSINILLNASDEGPYYDIGYVDVVTQPGSGDPVPVHGGAALQVVLGASAYDPDTGEQLLAFTAPENLLETTGFGAIQQVAFGGSFEGMTTFAVGVREELPFTVEINTDNDEMHYVTISVAAD